MSIRRLWVLVRGLPRESNTKQTLLGDRSAWTPDTYMLANIFDVLQQANWQRAGDKNARRPPLFPRPD